MRCQIPGCENRSTKINIKSGIFTGINLEDITIYTCDEHSESEIESFLEETGEKESACLQCVNPFLEKLS